MSIEVLLINPVDTTAASNSLDLSLPPLHLLYLAGALEQYSFNVKIFDDDVYKVKAENIGEIVNKLDPEIVGITATTANINECEEYLENIKKIRPDILTIIGGPHTTFLPLKTLEECPYIDIVAIGEGEETIVELTEAYLNRKNEDFNDIFSNIKGIAYKCNDKIEMTPIRPLIENLDEIPLPARHLIPFKEYSTSAQAGGIITSRGCPFGCNYCSSSLIMGKQYRVRSCDNVLKEIEELVYRYDIHDIAFLDDIFMLNKERAMEISSEIKNRGLDVTFVASSRVNTMDKELLKHLYSKGMSTVYFGVESGSQKILDLMNKGISLDQIRKAFNIAKDVGIDTLGSFILGYPGETKKDMNKTIKFAMELNPDWAQFSILTPFPGTPIYNKLKDKKLLETENWTDYTVLNSVINYEQLGLSKKMVERYLVKAYLKFYSRPKYLFNHKGRLSLVLNTINNAFIKPLYKKQTPRGWYQDFNIDS